MSEGYIGLSAEFVAEIGRFTIAAASAEEQAYRIGEMLSVDGIRERQLSSVLNAVRGRAGRAVEMEAELEPRELVEWCDALEATLDYRHDVIHSHYFRQFGWRSGENPIVRRRSRLGEGAQQFDVEATRAERRKLETLAIGGIGLWCALAGYPRPDWSFDD